MRYIKYTTKGKEHFGWLHTFSVPPLRIGQNSQSLLCVVEDEETGSVLLIPYTCIKLIDSPAFLRECFHNKAKSFFHNFVTLNNETFALIEQNGKLILTLPTKVKFTRNGKKT